MACDELPDNLRTLWKEDEAGMNPLMFPIDELRRETERLQARRRKGRVVLGVAMLAVAAGYALSLFLLHNALTRIGATLSVLVCGYWISHALIERARAAHKPLDTDGLRHYRAELERARDSYRWMSWRWMLLPGPFILFDAGIAQLYAKLSPIIVPFVCFDSALLLVALAIWAPLKNLKLARQYQDRINELDAAAGAGQPDRAR